MAIVSAGISKKPEQMLRQTDYARPIPDDLRPSEDVESVLPLGRFDSVVAGGVFDLMKTLKPWGETPLYLSSCQAIGEFAADEPGTEKSIVVITDGVNYQFNSPNPKSRADVMAAIEPQQIPIYIVGFGISPAEAAEAAREFGALAEQTDGKYVPVSRRHDADRIAGKSARPEELRSHLAPPRAGRGSGRGRSAPISIRPKPAGRRLHRVARLGASTIGALRAARRPNCCSRGRSHAITPSATNRTIRIRPACARHAGVALLGNSAFIARCDSRTACCCRFSVQRHRTAIFGPARRKLDRSHARSADAKNPCPPTSFYDTNYEPGHACAGAELVAEAWPAGRSKSTSAAR